MGSSGKRRDAFTSQRDKARDGAMQRIHRDNQEMQAQIQAASAAQKAEAEENAEAIKFLLPILLQKAELYTPAGTDVVRIDLRNFIKEEVDPVLAEGRQRFPDSALFENKHPFSCFQRLLGAVVEKYFNRGSKGIITIVAEDFRKGLAKFDFTFDEAAARALYEKNKNRPAQGGAGAIVSQ